VCFLVPFSFSFLFSLCLLLFVLIYFFILFAVFALMFVQNKFSVQVHDSQLAIFLLLSSCSVGFSF